MSVTLFSRSANCRHSVHLRVGAGCHLLGSARHESDPSRCSMLGLSLRFGGSSKLPLNQNGHPTDRVRDESPAPAAP